MWRVHEFRGPGRRAGGSRSRRLSARESPGFLSGSRRPGLTGRLPPPVAVQQFPATSLFGDLELCSIQQTTKLSKAPPDGVDQSVSEIDK